MKISSPNFTHQGKIPSKYTCDGENINPQIIIEETPEETKSLAIIVDDPDAPGGAWTHWLVWNISPEISKIEEGNVPEGAIEGMNSSKKTGWTGPCPPSGTHRYFFYLYALDTKLSLGSGATKGELEEKIKDHLIEEAELMGTYSLV